jgi:hypothetical protein
MRIACACAVALLITNSIAFPSEALAENKNATGLYLQFVQVVANERHKAGLSTKLLATAIVDGRLTYVVATDNTTNFEKGIAPEYIVGLLRDPRKGLVKGNLVQGLPFLQRVWGIAGSYMDKDLERSVMESEVKASILIDGRAPDPMARYSVLRRDVIGIYRLQNGSIIFEPNEEYELVNENGPIQLTPFIVKALFTR